LSEAEADECLLILQGNSIVRRYPQGMPHLLRVSFVEEDRTRLQEVSHFARLLDPLPVDRPLRSLLRVSRVRLTVSVRLFACCDETSRAPAGSVKVKLTIALSAHSYSQSSLRIHTMWMLSPFSLDDDDEMNLEEDEDGELLYPDLIDAETVRLSLGDFKRIAHQPTLYGARLPQGFTSSRDSVSLEEQNIITIADMLSTASSASSNRTTRTAREQCREGEHMPSKIL
jgi:hypothetical protein